MVFHLILTVCLLMYLYSATVISGTSSFSLYTDGACQDLYAKRARHTPMLQMVSDCGQANGIHSISLTSLDSGCYRIYHSYFHTWYNVLRIYLVTVYSDFCSSNPTAVRIGQCTTLQNSAEIATFSIDRPQSNGALEGSKTSLAAAAQTSTRSPTPFESTTSSQEPPQDSTTSTQSPSSSGSRSSSQEPQQVPTTPTHSSSSSSTSGIVSFKIKPASISQAHLPQILPLLRSRAPR